MTLDTKSRFFAAAASGDVPTLRVCLGELGDVDIRDARTRTALMIACLNKQVTSAKFLLKEGADPSLRDGINHGAADFAWNGYLENERAAETLGRLIEGLPRYRAGEEVFLSRAKSLAGGLRKQFGGRSRRQGVFGTHGAYEVRASHRGMQCLFSVFAGGFDLWIQNARCRDLGLLLNLEGQDNDDPARDLPGTTPWNAAPRDLPLYVVAGEREGRAASNLLQQDGVPEHLRALALGRFEWLVMGSGQWRFRHQGEDVAVIRRRVDALASIFELASAPIAAPLVAKRLGLRIGSKKRVAEGHTFGGETGKRIECAACRVPLRSIFRLDLGGAPLRAISWKDRFVEAACCFSCALPSASSETIVSYAQTKPRLLSGPEDAGFAENDAFEVRELVLTATASAAGSRVGGEPAWLQTDATPDCPSCHSSMRFLAQLSSTSRIMIGADMGRAYVFLCLTCEAVATVIQSG